MTKKNQGSQEHHSVVKKMKPALRKIYEELRPIYKDVVHKELDVKRRIGAKVSEIKNDKSTYGTGAVKRLAVALGLSDDTLYDWAKVAICFSEEEIKELSVRSEGDFSISYSHLKLLTLLKRSADRERLIDRVFEERMPTRELAKEIDKILNRSGAPRNARRDSPRRGPA